MEQKIMKEISGVKVIGQLQQTKITYKISFPAINIYVKIGQVTANIKVSFKLLNKQGGSVMCDGT